MFCISIYAMVCWGSQVCEQIKEYASLDPFNVPSHKRINVEVSAL